MNIVIDQLMGREVAILNIKIDSEKVTIRESRNPENEGAIRLVLSYAEALELAKAIIGQDVDAQHDSDWRHMAGSVE